jgi:hypothetical protein
MDGRHAHPQPTRSRVGLLLAALATACGLWFGITAPEVSPVTPGAGTVIEQGSGTP